MLCRNSPTACQYNLMPPTFVWSNEHRFRWVECQFTQLERCKTLNALQSSLHSLPSTLNETYDRIVADFDQNEKPEILRALGFLCFSSRPMLVCELIDAMAIQTDTSQDFDTRNRIEDPLDLLNMLPGLLSLSPSAKREHMSGFGMNMESGWKSLDDLTYYKVHFAHASVKDYFLSGSKVHGPKDFCITEGAAHTLIAANSLAYLLSTSEQYQSMQPEEMPLDIYPFSRYAIEELSRHLKRSGESMTLLDSIVKLFRADKFLMERAVHTLRRRLYQPATKGDGPTRDSQYLNVTKLPQNILRPGLSSRQQDLLCAATFLVSTGLVDLAVRVVQDFMVELEIERYDTEYLSTLLLWLLSQVASFTSADNRRMCEALMNLYSVEHNVNSALYQAMLSRHAYWGDLNTVVKILPEDNDLMARSVMDPINIMDLQETLEVAMSSPAMRSLFLFLQSRISSPLCCALEGKQWTIVQYFLDNHCLGWCKKSARGQFALDIAMYAAVHACSFEHVKLFLEEGANVNYKSESEADFTALYRASMVGELDIMDVLLDYGADVNVRTRFGSTPLHRASRKKTPEVAQLLLKRGADITLANDLGLTCLHHAVLRSRVDTIKFLLEAGADPWRRNVWGVTPKELLSIHLAKWTHIHDLQKRGPEALQALEDAEKKWVETHKVVMAEASSGTTDDEHELNKLENVSAQRTHSLQQDRLLETEQRIQVNDVVDIFIDVPQALPRAS